MKKYYEPLNKLVETKPWCEIFRNSRIRVVETGKIYDSIWSYIQITGESEADAKKCIKDPRRTTKDNKHLVVHDYIERYEWEKRTVEEKNE